MYPNKPQVNYSLNKRALFIVLFLQKNNTSKAFSPEITKIRIFFRISSSAGKVEE